MQRHTTASRRDADTAHGRWPVTVVALALSGCIVSDDYCDANQQRDPDNRGICVCVDNAVPNPRGYGCDLCGEHEEKRGGKCECQPGFARPAGSTRCEPSATSTLGQPCSDSAPCTEPYPYCATVAGESYCTNTGCNLNAECPTDWTCRSEGSVRFCGKVVGMLKPCASADACAGTEASYCEISQTKLCLVAPCESSRSCPSGWSCCDLTNFIQTSLCIRTDLLDNGECIPGQPPVSP